MKRTVLALSVVAALLVAAKPAAAPPVPDTPKKPVTDTIQGVAISDDYRWLEDARSPAVDEWSDAENARTRAILDGVPSAEAIASRLTDVLSAESTDAYDLKWANGKVFAIVRQPPKQQPYLVVLDGSLDLSKARVLVDPNTINKKGTTAIDFYVPSLSGRYVAVSLSEGGSESGTLHIFDVASGKDTGESIDRVNGGTAGGSVAWNGDGTGFWYTRYPRPGDVPASDVDFYQQVFYHRLGTSPTQDNYSIGKQFPRIAEIRLETSLDGKRVLASVENGDGGQYAHWLYTAGGQWVRLTHFDDDVVAATLDPDGTVWMESRHDAPKGRILHVDPDDPNLDAAPVVVPEGTQAIESFVATKTRLYVTTIDGGPTSLRVFDHAGKALGDVATPPLSSIQDVARASAGDDVWIREASYTTAPAWLHFADGKPEPTPLAMKPTVDFSDVEATREMATSKDGTQVPITILRLKDAPHDGSRPLILYGYGGYGISMSPGFHPALHVWLEQGGIYAIANIRGGGEYGDAWHRAGYRTTKQNVFDDFAAAAQYLVDTKWTSKDRIGAMGESNGGLLMGAMLTQHPELFRAVVSRVGIFDSLRAELDPNGTFNVTEFGTVADPDEFKALYDYSPYHHVRDGVAYPAVLMTTGKNDPRVPPYHSRKMVARLQAANTGSHPILLRTTDAAGHGMGSSLDEIVREQSDIMAFFATELGVAWKPVTKTK